MTDKIYKLDWMLRIFFPGLYCILFFMLCYRRIFLLPHYGLATASDILSLLLEVGLLGIMINLYTVEYRLENDRLAIIRFYFSKKIYFLKDFIWIQQEGSYHFLNMFAFGINAISINLKNGKRIGVIGLKDHFDFYQNIQTMMAQPHGLTRSRRVVSIQCSRSPGQSDGMEVVV